MGGAVIRLKQTPGKSQRKEKKKTAAIGHRVRDHKYGYTARDRKDQVQKANDAHIGISSKEKKQGDGTGHLIAKEGDGATHRGRSSSPESPREGSRGSMH